MKYLNPSFNFHTTHDTSHPKAGDWKEIFSKKKKKRKCRECGGIGFVVAYTDESDSYYERCKCRK